MSKIFDWDNDELVDTNVVIKEELIKNIVPNPTDTATKTLTKLKLGKDVYEILGGSGTTVIPSTEIVEGANYGKSLKINNVDWNFGGTNVVPSTTALGGKSLKGLIIDGSNYDIEAQLPSAYLSDGHIGPYGTGGFALYLTKEEGGTGSTSQWEVQPRLVAGSNITLGAITQDPTDPNKYTQEISAIGGSGAGTIDLEVSAASPTATTFTGTATAEQWAKLITTKQVINLEIKVAGITAYKASVGQYWFNADRTEIGGNIILDVGFAANSTQIADLQIRENTETTPTSYDITLTFENFVYSQWAQKNLSNTWQGTQSFENIVIEGDIAAKSGDPITDFDMSNAKTFLVPHITLIDPSTSTSGTLTDIQLATLQSTDNAYIIFNGEKYYLNNKEHTSGYLGYDCVTYENSKFTLKSITITISTKGWTLATKEVTDGGSSTPLYQHSINMRVKPNSSSTTGTDIQISIITDSPTPLTASTLPSTLTTYFANCAENTAVIAQCWHITNYDNGNAVPATVKANGGLSTGNKNCFIITYTSTFNAAAQAYYLNWTTMYYSYIFNDAVVQIR